MSAASSGNAAEATHDHVLFNVGTRQPDGTYAWGPTRTALQPRFQPGHPKYHPATPDWAAYHICDPEVIKGNFTYTTPQTGTKTYTWAMFFTGADNDDRGADGRFNVVGVALATSPLGPWTIVASPLIDITEPDYNAAGYGVGQPSVTSVDQQGNLLLFYSGLGCQALDTPDPSCSIITRGTAVRTLDLSDANAPILGDRAFVTVDGPTPEPYLPNSGRFLHNAIHVEPQFRAGPRSLRGSCLSAAVRLLGCRRVFRHRTGLRERHASLGRLLQVPHAVQHLSAVSA